MGNHQSEFIYIKNSIEEIFNLSCSIFKYLFPKENIYIKYHNLFENLRFIDINLHKGDLKSKITLLEVTYKDFSKRNANISIKFNELNRYIKELNKIYKIISKVSIYTDFNENIENVIEIFKKINDFINGAKPFDDKNQNSSNSRKDNYNNKINSQMQRSRQKEELMMAGDNIGRMLSTAEGLANKVIKQNKFCKYNDYDFFNSRTYKSEIDIVEQLISQIEFAEINYSLYLRDHKGFFPFEEENNIETICEDIDNMKNCVDENYKFLYTAMKNLLLREDNSEFIKKVELYDQMNSKKAKMDPKVIGAYGVQIVNYHEQKKEISNQEIGNTYKFNINGRTDPLKTNINSQSQVNMDIMTQNNNPFDPK